MDKNKKVKEAKNEELSSHQILVEKLSSIEYRLDSLTEKFSSMEYRRSDVYIPLLRQYPVITCHVQFLTADRNFVLNISGEHFSKSNNLIKPPIIRTANVTVDSVSGTGLGNIPIILKNVKIDENGKFNVRVSLKGSHHIFIEARNNSTGEYTSKIRINLTYDNETFGVSNG